MPQRRRSVLVRELFRSEGDVTREVGHAASQDQIPECAHPGSVREHCPSAESARTSVSVIIPAYNMAWCLTRAVGSCLSQTRAPSEIIIVDDCSPDDTTLIVRELMARDCRIRYHRLSDNGGHLAALQHGLRRSTSAWAALLDADDELTPDSIERRIDAAGRYHTETGEWPQLVYGDLYWNEVAPGRMAHFKVLRGRGFRFLCRELSLCQTSTIMLGREAISHFPEVTNPYNTDDEIVLAVGKHFPLVHAGTPVAVVHAHASPTRMTNSLLLKFRGIRQLVQNHRADIVREHGRRHLFLWRLRIVRAFLEWQNEWAGRKTATYVGDGVGETLLRSSCLQYGQITREAHRRLTSWLESRFEQMYF